MIYMRIPYTSLAAAIAIINPAEHDSRRCILAEQGGGGYAIRRERVTWTVLTSHTGEREMTHKNLFHPRVFITLHIWSG